MYLVSDVCSQRFADRCGVHVCIYSEPSPALALMPKENIGYGSAFQFYYGYLRLVLPGNLFNCYSVYGNRNILGDSHHSIGPTVITVSDIDRFS